MRSSSSPIPESSIGFSDTWRVRRAAPGTRSSRARHRGPEAIPCHEFQRRPLEHWANLDPKLRTLHVCPSGAPNAARIRWGERTFHKRGSLNLEPAFRPAKPGLIAQRGCHLRWPLETFRCVRDRMSYSFAWANVQAKLEANTEKLWSLNEMERTGGEPDVVGHDKKTGEYIFYDCSAESPKGRRNVCYDREGQEARKAFKPKDNAIDMAAAMGIELLTEEQYRELQKLGNVDTKTSSWVKTPSDIRKFDGALFCDRRYETGFVYHNGAESYYAARAFRGSLRG